MQAGICKAWAREIIMEQITKRTIGPMGASRPMLLVIIWRIYKHKCLQKRMSGFGKVSDRLVLDLA